jgi:hypothetical protein
MICRKLKSKLIIKACILKNSHHGFIRFWSDDQIETTHAYKYIGVDFYSHGYFEPSSGNQGITCMEPLTASFRKEALVGVTSWELKSYLFKALVLPTFRMVQRFGGWGVEEIGKIPLEGFLGRHEDTNDDSNQSVFFKILP